MNKMQMQVVINRHESKIKELDNEIADRIANFGAWLVDNHECRFMGGEIEIAQLCSDYVEQLNLTNTKKG